MRLADGLSRVLGGARWADMHRGIVRAVVDLGPDAQLGRLEELVIGLARRMELWHLAECYGHESSAVAAADERLLEAAQSLMDQVWGAHLADT